MQKTAVVTGASGGIGRAISTRLAQEGYHVIGLYCHHRDSAVLSSRDIPQNALGQIDVMQCDLRDPSSVQHTFAEILRFYHHIDLLVCSHGVASIRLFSDTDEAEWDRILSVNLTGTYRAIYASLPDMISRKSGNIITVSSMWGEVGASCEVAYSASKAGIIGLTKALAKELGPSQIRVNCVSPGLIDTEMNQELTEETVKEMTEETPLGRIGTPQDVADAVAFLASSSASFITGQVIGISGGYLI
ncbi:MAG: 3-oxoacyl-ACP reductase FabG [Clostridia bacterium]|nr:3-oxoacyl-ACP reductase FabG [Clostridia bacterium]